MTASKLKRLALLVVGVSLVVASSSKIPDQATQVSTLSFVAATGPPTTDPHLTTAAPPATQQAPVTTTPQPPTQVPGPIPRRSTTTTTEPSPPTPTEFTGDIPDLIRSVFGTEKAVRVADCESSLNPNNVSPDQANWGLFQINVVHKEDFEQFTGHPWSDVLDPKLNTDYAYKLSKGGSDWSAWTCRGA